MIKKYEYPKNNIVYLDGEYDKKGNPKIDKRRTSHKLELSQQIGLYRYICFDTESNSLFYYKDKRISREEYNSYDQTDLNLKKLFELKTIQAVFCTKNRRVRKVYILGDSEYKNKKIRFSYVNQVTGKFCNITAEIIFHDKDIIKLFMDDVMQFCHQGDPEGFNQTKIFCHNAKHDWLQIGMFNFHKKFKLEIKNFNLTTPRFAMWFKDPHFIMEWIDTTNYFKQKLKSIGKDIGILKQEEKTDWNKDLIIDKQFIEYGIIDTEILAEKMWLYANMVKEYGKLGYGVPSTAFSIWATSFMDCNIWLHKNPDLMQIERKSYSGGRTEAFKLGFYSNVYGIDINSSYPYQMENELPIEYDFSLLGENEYISIAKYKSLSKNYCLLGELIVTSNLPIPVIPYHHDGKLLFINGENIDCVLCQPEIDLLLELNCEVKIKKLHCYKKGYAMKRFSNYCMDGKVKAKNAGDINTAQFWKDNGNNSYGKLCERIIDTVISDCDPNLIGNMLIVVPALNKKVNHKHLAGKRIRTEKTMEDAENAFCPMGSFITSYARVHLYKTMLKIGRENIIYCDTDSIYFINNNNIIDNASIDFDPVKIGAWDIEEKNINMLVFGAKDYYKFDTKMNKKKQKLKGVSLGSAIEIDQNTYVISQWQGFHYAFKTNQIESQAIINIEKTLSRNYEKAKVLNKDNIQSIEYFGEYQKDENGKTNIIKYDKSKTLEFIQSEILHFSIDMLK
jgi:hypothetical protein